jgi:hypothetical protein
VEEANGQAPSFGKKSLYGLPLVPAVSALSAVLFPVASSLR